MKRVWQVPKDVRTVHLGGFTPEHGAEIAQRMDEAGIAYWAKVPSGFFTRIWERDTHVFVDRTRIDEARAIAAAVVERATRR
ncbi:MAG TPA: hypothetical protein VG993_01275 [Actinomycetota bacterium]|nr:hypothetical protein [Actinomycetota bacterium]